MLFTPARIGNLDLPNRLVRSATAEFMAEEDGQIGPRLKELYRDLTRGGVGLIITGHMYVHPSGKAHPRMTGAYSDDLLPGLAELADVIHKEDGRVVVQINHGGMKAHPDFVADPIAPSAVDSPKLQRPAREMTTDEIHMLINAYAQAARRVKDAGFDGVQIHNAHGYLGSQFLSPYVNHRTDEWGGDLEGRTHFLRAVCQAVRGQVGADYPMLIKLGMMESVEGGLTAEEGTRVVASLADMGLDALEISGGVSGEKELSVPRGIKAGVNEAYFRHLAKRARPVTDLPIISVGGFRSRPVMEEVLAEGDANFISLCRPLICEPDLPNRMRDGLQDRSLCISANLCFPRGFPESAGETTACRCAIERG